MEGDGGAPPNRKKIKIMTHKRKYQKKNQHRQLPRLINASLTPPRPPPAQASWYFFPSQRYFFVTFFLQGPSCSYQQLRSGVTQQSPPPSLRYTCLHILVVYTAEWRSQISGAVLSHLLAISAQFIHCMLLFLSWAAKAASATCCTTLCHTNSKVFLSPKRVCSSKGADKDLESGGGCCRKRTSIGTAFDAPINAEKYSFISLEANTKKSRGCGGQKQKLDRYRLQCSSKHENDKQPPLDWFYDSPPPKPAIFFSDSVSWLLDTRKNDRQIRSSHTFFFAKEGLVVVLSNDGVGVARGTIFQEICPGAGFKTNRRFR